MRKTLRVLASAALFTLACLPAFAADAAKAAASSPQAKAYETMRKAVAAGDYQAMRATMSKATLAKMDQQNKDMHLDTKKGMEMMKDMAPTDLKFTDVKVTGSKAVLSATGKVMGEANWGTIEETNEGGQWKIDSESWTNTKKK
jgi:opacity protein-like surface antigen